MKQFVALLVFILLSSPVHSAPATSPNPRSNEAVLHPTFNKEACCKCWNDLYHNGADWQVAHRPRPCDGDCTCDWCGTNNANATYGTPCAGAGSLGNWGYCVANCDAPPPPPSGTSATPPSIIKTLPPTTLPSEHSSSIIMTLPPTTFSTETKYHDHPDTSIPPLELKHKRQDSTMTYSNDPSFTSTDIPVITDSSFPSATDTTIFFPTGTDSTSFMPTSSWGGGTTIENTGTLTFGGGTETMTFGSETLTFTFPPVPVLSLSAGGVEEDIEERQFFPLTPTGRPWTTESDLPVSTSWYGGGPGFSLTFTAGAAAATENIIEIEKKQINTITWGESTLPASTYWGGGETITIGGETITFGGNPGGPMSLTIGPEDAVITARPEVNEEDIGKRQVGVIITGGPWTEDNGATFTDYWGYPGETVTLLGPHGDETLTLSGTPRHITPPATTS
ncbi:uncharacterized protein LY89DRAFT_725331 [Mollisia scopiformis]|uniref:Uncharacterized protein n=1 Tax=Mollisia scopiformis TaxID=149040 RepID=A0A132B6F2_MOLSC|nr:uncharacterized protein LY89DRAFT_725331 [Mollisia scopiformis]KUJ07988.1 hypothetical protein LY89DRAFT_725331 [Mollisia scopiformis]